MGAMGGQNSWNTMSAGSPGPGQDIPGGYNFEARRTEVFSKFNEKLAEIEIWTKTLAGINGNAISEVRSNFSAGADGVEGQLGTLRSTFVSLQESVRSYDGPHYKKLYRKIISDGANLQMELDKLEVTGREDLRQERKTLMCSIDICLKEIGLKVHPEGVCQDCEVFVV